MLKIHQIYYDEASKKNCYPEWEHYYNQNLTEHFENSVIVDLIDNQEHLKSKYFGVFSHDIKKEIYFKEDNRVFNPANLWHVVNKNQEVDVFSFFKRRKQKNIILQAENYHTGFVGIINTILKETGFLPNLPKILPDIVLFNHFVARSDIYEQYVNELLKPAMEVLEGLPEAYNDAKYKDIDDKTKARFMGAFGKPYYPYHPFIEERLPSLFLAKYKFKTKQIF